MVKKARKVKEPKAKASWNEKKFQEAIAQGQDPEDAGKLAAK